MIRSLDIQLHHSEPPTRRWRGGARSTPAQLFVNAQLPAVEQRWVLAYELGHLMLGQPGEYADDIATLGSVAAHRRFAEDLLMPWWLVEPHVYDKPPELAQRFEVPVHAMTMRVHGLLFGN